MIKRINVIRRIKCINMKKIYFILAGFGIVANCYGQIIITQNDLPVPGETWIEYSDPSTTVNLTPASGSSQTWDYSTSFSGGTTRTYNYISPPQTCGFSYFPNADLGRNTIGTGGTDTTGYFYESNSGGLYLQGYYHVNMASSSSLSYDSNQVVIPVPFTYGSSRSVAGSSVTYSHIAGFFDSKTVSSNLSYCICDAYGTLRTPANPVTPVDVIRIKFRLLSGTDSIFYDTTGTGIFYLDTVVNYGPSLGTSYQFFKQKNSCISKVMTIEYDSAGQYVDMARYYECFLTTVPQNNKLLNFLNIFPNPATSTIQLTFNTKHNGPLMCEIINVMGERVFRKEFKQTDPDMHRDDVLLDVSFLAKGMYVVRVGDGTVWENKKLVVE
jgi:hypothetical protein